MHKLLFLVLVFSISIACYKDSIDINTPEELSSKLTDLQSKSILPGFAVSVIKGDSVYFQQGFGYADRFTKSPYTPQTIQPVGSVSKTFVGLALMKAVELGHFTLETKINDLLPFTINNPNIVDSPIRIKHLATHTSGILDNPEFYAKTYELGQVPSMSLGNFLKDYFTVGSIYYATANFSNSKSGEQFNYSNIGSALAAYLIEVKTGESFDTFTRRVIFDPLSLTNTHWFYDATKADRYATLYEVNSHVEPLYDQLLNADGSVKTYCSITYPDGALKTSCADLAIYLKEMIRGYAQQGGSPVTNESYKVLFLPQFTESTMPKDMDPKEPNRAIFWAIGRTGRITHTGGDPGISAFISFNPSTLTGRIVTMNTQLDGDDNIKAVTQFTEIAKAISEYEASLK